VKDTARTETNLRGEMTAALEAGCISRASSIRPGTVCEG